MTENKRAIMMIRHELRPRIQIDHSRKTSTLITAVALAVVLQVSSASAVSVVQMLDDFDVFQHIVTPGGLNAGAFSTVGGPGNTTIFGKTRSGYVEKTSGSENPLLRVETLVDDFDQAYTLNVNRSAGIGGVALLQWDGGIAGPQDFDPLYNLYNPNPIIAATNFSSTALGIVIRVLSTDVAGQTLTVDLFSGSENDRSTQSVILPAIAGATDILFPWAGFLQNGDNPANFTAIQGMTLSIEGPAGSDIGIDYIATYVPEPTSVSILTLGAAALITHSFRKRRRAVTEIASNA